MPCRRFQTRQIATLQPGKLPVNPGKLPPFNPGKLPPNKNKSDKKRDEKKPTPIPPAVTNESKPDLVGGGIVSQEKTETPPDGQVPPESLKAIESELGNDVARNVQRVAREIASEINGDWGSLEAAAR